MKKLMMLLAVAGLVSAPAWVAVAADDAAAGAAAAKPEHKAHVAAELKEMTVTGTISKEEHKGHDGKTMEVLVLTETDGTKVFLHSEKDADAATNPAEFVGKCVTIVGQGSERTTPKGKMIRIAKITSIKAA